MPTLVSTGQITIVDNNDARPITALISANRSTQQIYNPDSAPNYTPDYSSTSLILTALVYVGGTSSATESASLLTNKKWSSTFDGTSLGGATSLSIGTNTALATPQLTYYFQGDYTDPITGLVSRVVCTILVTVVRTGTNASFLTINGSNVIIESQSSTKAVAALFANFYRGSTLDTSVTRYKWYKLVAGNWQQIYTGNTALDTVDGLGTTTYTVAQQYGFRLEGDASLALPVAVGTSVQPSVTDDLIVRRGITISELAVIDLALFKCEVVDGSETYSITFTVYDVADPYDTQIISTAGDKLQNGVGTTNLIPKVYNGASLISDLTGWSFKWSIFDRNGLRAAFVDETRTAVAVGRGISVNSAGTSAVFTYAGTAITFAADDVIKVVTPAGLAFYYTVASGTGNTVTIKTGTPFNFTDFVAPTLSQFVGGILFVGKTTETTSGGALETAAQISLTGYEVDAKARIICESTRP